MPAEGGFVSRKHDLHGYDGGGVLATCGILHIRGFTAQNRAENHAGHETC